MNNQLNQPNWIKTLLNIPYLMFFIRTALVSAFLIGGINKLLNFQAAVAEQALFGLQPAWIWASLAIIIEIFGSLAVLFNRFVWLGAGGLGILTAVAMFVASNFWNLTGDAQFAALNTFFEHLGLIAGLVLVTKLSFDKPTQ